MNFNLIPTERFKKEPKRLIKKYPSLKDELSELNEILEKNPETGTSLGYNAASNSMKLGNQQATPRYQKMALFLCFAISILPSIFLF